MYNINEQNSTMILKDKDQIKAYLHPTRMALLQMLARERMTISGAARVLKVHPANITHHFKALEKVGLVSLVEKMNNGKNLEKYYLATAKSFIVKPEGEQLNKKALILSVLKDSLSTAIETAKAGDERLTLGLLDCGRLTQEQSYEFVKRLYQLMQEFKEMNDPDGETYFLNIGLYPSDISYDMIPKEDIYIT